MNIVHIMGRLGKDPEIRHTQTGMVVCQFSVATDYTRKDKATGDKVKTTEWHTVVLFDKAAEVAAQYLGKGCKVQVSGRLQTEKFTDKNGVEKRYTKIIGEQFEIVTFKEDSAPAGHQAEERPAPPKAGPKNIPPKSPPQPSGYQGGVDDFDDSIPF